MRNCFLTSLIACGIMLVSSCAQQQQYEYPFQNPKLSIDKRVENLLSLLQPEEKVGLMVNESRAVPRLGIPEYDWWNEALHGVARAGRATVFPQAIGMAATWNEPAHLETFTIISDEARAKYNDAIQNNNRERYYGLSFWTPNINIFRDPRWGRGQETYGEDPFLTARFGVAAVKGLQGDHKHYFKSHACAKHYAVHSGPESNRHSYNATASGRDLWETYLPAFKALVQEANVREVMCAYNALDGQPCCGSDVLMTYILREKWGYDGIVVSDCGAINNFYHPNRHATHPDAASAAADAVIHTTDLECGSVYNKLMEAMERGLITEEQIDVSLRRILRGWFELGMLDPAEIVPWSNIPYSIVDSPEHQAKALDVTLQSMTLLKNESNTLPLSKDVKKVAVIGANAADSVMLWGNYNGFPSQTVTILDGIKAKVPNAEIIYDKGCELVDPQTAASPDNVFAELTDRIKDVDIIIYVGGLSPSLEGEEMPVNAEGFKSGDKISIDLPTVQRRLLADLKATGKPVVFVLCTGSALALEQDEDNYDALLCAWYGGQAGGTAVADVLFGDYSPAGRLPVTFYKTLSQLEDALAKTDDPNRQGFENYDMTGRTYRYMTEEPLYPFGHGLSYLTFAYGDAKISSKISARKGATITIPVTNTSSAGGDEVVQVYVRRNNDPAAPVKSLRAFRRVTIEPNSTENVKLHIGPDAFEFYDEAVGNLTPKGGSYTIMYGGTSADSGLKSVDVTVEV